MPRLSLLVEQLHNGGYFVRIIRVECSRREAADRRHALYLSRCHVLDCRIEPRFIIRYCVRPDDGRRWLPVPFLPELRPFTYLQVQHFRLWIAAHGRIPPYVDLSLVLLLG